MNKSLASIPYEVEGMECTIEVSAWGYYDPGKHWGPVEDCYPPEGEPHEYAVMFNGVEVLGCDDDLVQEAIDEYAEGMRDD